MWILQDIEITTALSVTPHIEEILVSILYPLAHSPFVPFIVQIRTHYPLHNLCKMTQASCCLSVKMKAGPTSDQIKHHVFGEMNIKHA